MRGRVGRWMSAGGLVATLALGACAPDVIDRRYPTLDVRLWGPDTSAGAVDPFGWTTTYQITLRLWEDANGRIPYGTSLPTPRPEAWASFTPVIRRKVPGTSQRFSLSTGSLELPQVGPGQSEVWYDLDIVGLNSEGRAVARARCPLSRLVAGSGSISSCRAFYGILGRWNPVASVAQARVQFAATALSDGRVLVAGGIDPDHPAQGPLASTEVWDPAGNDAGGAWTLQSDALGQAGRYDLGAFALPDGSALLIGGARDRRDVMGRMDRWSPAGTVEAMTALTAPRAGQTVVGLTPDTAVLLGGATSEWGAAAAAEIVGPTQAPTAIGGSLVRYRPCAGRLDDGSVLVCGGGWRGAGDGDRCERFVPQPAEGSETPGHFVAAGRGVPRTDVGCAITGADEAWVVGGGRAEVERWSSGGLESVGRLPGDVRLTGASVDRVGPLVLVAGGRDGEAGPPIDATVAIDPRARTVTALSDVSLGEPRADHRTVHLSDGNVLLMGGVGLDGKGIRTALIYVDPSGVDQGE